MQIVFEKKIFKDFDKVDDFVLQKVQALISGLRNTKTLEEIKIGFDCKKMQGYTSYYRIRIGEYRLGFSVDKDQVRLIRFLHRKDIYKFFP